LPAEDNGLLIEINCFLWTEKEKQWTELYPLKMSNNKTMDVWPVDKVHHI